MIDNLQHLRKSRYQAPHDEVFRVICNRHVCREIAFVRYGLLNVPSCNVIGGHEIRQGLGNVFFVRLDVGLFGFCLDRWLW